MQIIQDRRALHQIPELELELPKTMQYVVNTLKPLNCQILTPIGCAVCAYFDFGAAAAIAFRADMDALPIQEHSEKPYASTHPGCMHACGHDGHTAILLELARRLSQKETLGRNVLLIFQPGEESPGGALGICRTGILEQYRVEAIFGLHLWPGLETGKVYCRENEMMSHASEINIDFYGRSAHIAKYGAAIDAMAAAMEFHRQVTAAEQSLPPQTFRLLKFGRMFSGTVRNAVADHARLEGSLRAFQDEVFAGLTASLHIAAENVERQFGCRVEISQAEGYPAVLNDPGLYQKISALLPLSHPGDPSMTAEDFGWYQKFVPGLFFFLGLGNTPALHAADFDFDDRILVKGADFFEELAEKYQ